MILTDSIKVFAEEFNELNWLDYVKYCKKEFNNLSNDVKKCLDDIVLPEDIKVVLICRLKSYAKKWLFNQIPALEGKKPIDMIKNETELKALKEALLRMPD